MAVALSKKISELPLQQPTSASLFPFADPADLTQTKATSFLGLMDTTFALDDRIAMRSLMDRLRDGVVRVEEMGGAVDGVTDDTEAFEAAVARAIIEGKAVSWNGTLLVSETPAAITGQVAIVGTGMGGSTLKLVSPGDPGNSRLLWCGNPALDPAEGESGRPAGQPYGIFFSGITFECGNELWNGLEILGPYDGATLHHEIEFSAAVTEWSCVGVIVDGEPQAVNLYQATLDGSATVTFDWAVSPGSTIWFIRQPETAWALENQGTTQLYLERCRFLGVSGLFRDGGKQRNNGTRYKDTQATVYAYQFPGRLQQGVAAEDSGDVNDEDNAVAPHSGWAFFDAEEAADGSRVEFSFDLTAWTGGIGTLLAIEPLTYLTVDGAKVSAVDYAFAGDGTSTVTLTLDSPPTGGDQVRLWHYVIPIGLPASWYAMHNSGPARLIDAHWTGIAGDHRLGGAIIEYRPTNGYTPSTSVTGGATGDTKLIQHLLAQGFWSPHASSIAWETATAAEAANGSRTEFTFTFVEAAVFRQFRPYVDGVAATGTEFSATGYGTTVVVVTFDTAPENGAEVTARRLYDVTPKGKPYGLYQDYTEGHVSNVFANGAVIDHTTVAALYIGTRAYKDGIPYLEGGEYRSFFRFGLYHNWRWSVDAGQAIRIEADTDEPCADIIISGSVMWRRRDDYLVDVRGNYSGLVINGNGLHELPSGIRSPRRALCRFAGNDAWQFINNHGGKIGRALYIPATTVVEVTNARAKEYVVTGNAFPAGTQGYTVMVEPPRSISAGPVSLGSNPLTFFAPGSRLLEIAWAAHGRKRGDEIVLANATAGGGLPASSINGTWIVYAVNGADKIRVIIADACSEADVFGGGSVTITAQKADWIRADAVLEGALSTSNGSAVVTVNHVGHGVRSGDAVNVVSVETPPGGFSEGDITGFRTATRIDADNWSFVADTTADGSGGDGDEVVFEYWGDRSRNRVATGNTPNGGTASLIANLPTDTTIADADLVPFSDADESDPDFAEKAITWANLKTVLVTALSSSFAPAAAGVPAGGTTGQVLVKTGDGDHEVGWDDAAGGAVDSVNGQTGTVVLDADDVGALASGGYTGPILIGRDDTTTGALEVITVSSGLGFAGNTLTAIVQSVNGAGGAVVLDYDDVGGAPAAAGLPTGGTTGQYLQKTSGTDYAVAWDTITFSDLPNVTGPVLVGRDDTTSGSIETLTLTAPLVASGGAVAIQLSGAGLLGRDDTTAGGVETLSVAAPLALSGNALTTSLAQARVLGRATASTGAVEALALTGLIEVSASNGDIRTRISNSRLAGRTTPGAGVFEEIEVIEPLSLTGLQLGLTGSALTEIYIPARLMRPRVSNGCAALAVVEVGANALNMEYLGYDPSAAEYAQFDIALPKRWNAGTITARVIWSHPATATNFGVVWGIQARSIADDNPFNAAFGTAMTVADTGGTTNDLYITAYTSAITVSSAATGELQVFQVYRDPANGSDTMAVDARLHGVQLAYTTNAFTDA